MFNIETCTTKQQCGTKHHYSLTSCHSNSWPLCLLTPIIRWHRLTILENHFPWNLPQPKLKLYCYIYTHLNLKPPYYAWLASLWNLVSLPGDRSGIFRIPGHVRRKSQEEGKNYTVMSFIIYTTHRIVFICCNMSLPHSITTYQCRSTSLLQHSDRERERERNNHN